MNSSVHVADTYISSVHVIKHICIPNLTSEDDRAEKTFRKGISLSMKHNISAVVLLSPVSEEV